MIMMMSISHFIAGCSSSHSRFAEQTQSGEELNCAIDRSNPNARQISFELGGGILNGPVTLKA
jgi:hypothetical protein